MAQKCIVKGYARVAQESFRVFFRGRCGLDGRQEELLAVVALG